jgi:hypothetical protein
MLRYFGITNTLLSAAYGTYVIIEMYSYYYNKGY